MATMHYPFGSVTVEGPEPRPEGAGESWKETIDQERAYTDGFRDRLAAFDPDGDDTPSTTHPRLTNYCQGWNDAAFMLARTGGRR